MMLRNAFPDLPFYELLLRNKKKSEKASIVSSPKVCFGVNICIRFGAFVSEYSFRCHVCRLIEFPSNWLSSQSSIIFFNTFLTTSISLTDFRSILQQPSITIPFSFNRPFVLSKYIYQNTINTRRYYNKQIRNVISVDTTSEKVVDSKTILIAQVLFTV